MNTHRGSLIPREVETPKELQLRVIPLELKFRDTLAGKVYRQPITIHNLGRSNQKIRFLEPTNQQFRVIFPGMEKELASGLQITAMVEYHPNTDENTFEQLYIIVGSKAMEIPLTGLIPCCDLEIEPEVNFGTLVANSKVHCKDVKITNRGKVRGTFSVEYWGPLPIVISPIHGVVEPKSSKTVKVDFCADQPRVVNEVAKVRLQGHPFTLLNIKVHVVEQIIELLNINDNTKVECIRFGCIYFGTSKIEHALLYNNSPESVNWVAVIQNDSVGEELGINTQQRTDVAIHNLAYFRQVKNIDVTTFISCFPNEGTLLPYQKIKITFCFSPKITGDHRMDDDPAHRQDYVVFLRFDTVGSKDGFLRDDNSKTIKSDQFEKLELALTGSGVPVVLQFDLGSSLNFPPCSMGERSEVTFIMENRSKFLPVLYHFKKIANFRIDPQRGKLGETCVQKVTCSFIPHQYGVFKVKQFIEFIGPVADKNCSSFSLKPFHQIYLIFKSTCKASTKNVSMKINPGIPPSTSNSTEQTMVKDLAKSKECAPLAMLPLAKTSIQSHRLSTEPVKVVQTPFPNKQAASVRPGERDKQFRTISTLRPRLSYVDPEYAYTNSEILKKKANEGYYKKYIDHLRNKRLQKQGERKDDSFDDKDIRLDPKSGLKTPPLSDSEIQEDPSPTDYEPEPHQLLCTRNMESRETNALERKVLKGLKSKPSTPHEIRDCSLILTPRQIHQVIVGPSVLNFGVICVHSINMHKLHVVNMLPRHVLIKLDVNLKELQKTKQFSYVIPPSSSTYISIIFHSSTPGKYWKSFTFTVNSIPGGHLLVMAIIMPVRLELSSNHLVLKPHGFLLQTYFRGTVTLSNHQNYLVRFQWMPVNTDKGIAFFICPSEGTVDPFSSMECEVTWHPGFSSPQKGQFVLHIDEGSTVILSCVVKVGEAKVLFLEPRILFYDSPQGLTTWKKIVLHNVGQTHAFYKVRRNSLLSVLNIVPPEGIIPFGGLSTIYMTYTPDTTDKFQARVKIAIRHGNDVEIRVSGSAEVADVEIKPNVFFFSGTFIGGTQVIPFIVKNKTITRVRVEFNLEGRPCFSMTFKNEAGNYTDPDHPKLYCIELEGKKSMQCGIAFSPDEVRVYEFCFQVRINFYDSSELYTEYHVLNAPIPPNTVPLIQPCYVQAVVLQAPVKLSKNEFVFNIVPSTVNTMENVRKTQKFSLRNLSKRNVDWAFDISKSGKLFKKGIFAFSELSGTLQPYEQYNVSVTFCPDHPTKYTANIPVHLNNNPTRYQVIHLTGEIKSPKLLFDPPYIFFTSVPLKVAAVMNVRILPQNYYRDAILSVTVPPIIIRNEEEEDEEDEEEGHDSLYVHFPKGKAIRGFPTGINSELTCQISFQASKPVSFFTNIVFNDNRGNGFSFPVIGTAENCILTMYPHLAAYLHKNPVLYSGEMEPSSENLKLEESDSNEGESLMESEEEGQQCFPEPGTGTYKFFQQVVIAAQIWFSLFGWPGGPHAFSIPESIRRDVCKIQTHTGLLSHEDIPKPSDSLKYNKTIYDVIRHLSGKMPDGIHPSQSLPEDPTERVIQLYKQHSSVLNFLSAKGAYIAHVLPEFLFEPEDYKKWIELRSSAADTLLMYSPIPKEKHCFTIDMAVFENWSKRSWTDVFLQLYKVLVLTRVVPHSGKDLPPMHLCDSAKVNPSFEYSNIYSDYEKILLSWLNTYYENTRNVIWQNYHKDCVPKERWILNFDTDLSDGLVFATLLGGYCPFLIERHFMSMYTYPKTIEQVFHNSLMIVNSLLEIGLTMGIKASDICDPNPILMLMFCVFLYEKLPQFVPKEVVIFNCTLHETVIKTIQVRNSTRKAIVYKITFIGRDATDFSLHMSDDVVTIPAESHITVTVQFTSRFLHPAEASLMLMSKSKLEVGSTVMVFALRGEVHKFHPIKTIKCKTACYQWKNITVKVTNPFHTAGDFNVIVVESSTLISLTSKLNASRQFVSQKNQRSSFIREFFCSPTIHLRVKEPSRLVLSFVPFELQIRYCVIILSNREIGELIYAVEGKVTIPLPSRLPARTSSVLHNNEYKSPPEDCNEEDSVLYLKCKPKDIMDVELILPLTNEAKEKALAYAAQRQMSDVEYQRRLLTGTLESSSIRVAIALLGLTRVETSRLFNISKLKQPKFISYVTSVSLPGYFHVPREIYIPQHPEIQAEGHKPADGSFAISLRFTPVTPGRYPCQILLVSNYDVRLYYVEGVVFDKYPAAALKFETPTFQALTQKIPITNKTKKECKYRVTIEGETFDGPPEISVAPGETLEYPLTFKPVLEHEVTGKLTVENKIDGMEYVFTLEGIGKRPVALEHIVANCQVGVRENRTIMVPNYTKDLVIYKVSSNLPILWGEKEITIGPADRVPYVVHIKSLKSGIFKGELAFFIKNSQGDDSDNDSVPEQDRDQQQIQNQAVVPVLWRTMSEIYQKLDEVDRGDFGNLQVWYDLEIHIHPEGPVHVIEMTCTALESIWFEIPLRNVKEMNLHIQVLFSNPALSGLKEFVLNSQDCIDYVVSYIPSAVGCRTESIIFQPDKALEFWYLLKFTVELPKPTVMPEVQCDLGKYIIQTISLINPTHETLKLQAKSNNPFNFPLEPHKSPLIIPPHGTGELPVRYRPSVLGRTGQQASIIFSCAQFEEWKFLLSGVGLFPQPLEIETMTTFLNEVAATAITFENPTKENVFVDALLTSRHMPKNVTLGIKCDSFLIETPVFKITLRPTRGIPLPPRGIIDIPVVFTPSIVKLKKTMLVIQMMRADGKKWPIDNFDELSTDMKRMMGVDSGEIEAIRWIYPIIGLPEAKHEEFVPVVLQCQAKKWVKGKVQVSLAGDFSGSNPILRKSDFRVFPRKRLYSSYEDVDVLPLKREFEYELIFKSEKMKSELKPCIAISMTKKTYSNKTQLITLDFDLLFSPRKPLRSQVILRIECKTDGVWNFPMTLIATEPDVDGVINVPGTRLLKEAVTQFWLSSGKRDADPFTAYFLPGSDPEFFVKPQAGEIPPGDTDGIALTVGYTPKTYGRNYRAKLVVQTEDKYYLYAVNGFPEVIGPPMNVKARIDATNKKFDNRPIYRHDFITENAKLPSTGVSSTIKGDPLMLKKK
ncbi:cilia- and flagella-associated protein 47 [Sturnira hondurensis]|uniref:cilia- and flagella-associated protein 47 n=1 Tax=Sturnira hondurensis TaxID=192404 RepID=UPI0018796D03|nr:cilia- and flagella-associated protein 47 [Sturnira hondurensis]